MEQPYDFRTQADALTPAILDLLRKVVENEDVKLVHRLKAADMLLSRTQPTLKSVEIKSVSPVNIIMVSPVAQAREVLNNAAPPVVKALPDNNDTPAQ